MILGDETIGTYVQRWRTNLGLTVAEAARASGVGPAVWSRIESGVTANPLFETVQRMFNGLGATVEVKASSQGEHIPQPPLPPQLPLPKAVRKPDNRVHADA